jgi:scyllo-inositol 2-dehydrogenase (NADP+)
MRMIVIGLGNQGRKRLTVAGADVVATVDPVTPTAAYSSVDRIPLDTFDGAFVCTPDRDKLGILTYLLARGKHVLVEKPLLPDAPDDLLRLRDLARSAGAACYTAYNHRFEPAIRRLREVIDAGTLGSLYMAKLFYGNGTAADVRASPWRDQGIGVLGDLGSHLLDLTDYLLGRPTTPFRLFGASCFENRSLDAVAFGAAGQPAITLEASLLCWRNTFRIELYGAKGSAHLDGLCKWGPSTLTVRHRVFPSGRPPEESWGVQQPDPTWEAEYAHFRQMCHTAGTNIGTDLWIASVLRDLRTQSEGNLWAA